MTTARILVVDDEAPPFYNDVPKLSRARIAALEALVGLKLDFAADFLTAMEKLRGNRYDFVITDLNFPSISEAPKGKAFTRKDTRKFFHYLKKSFNPSFLRQFEREVGPFFQSKGSPTNDLFLLHWWKDESVIPCIEREVPVLGILVADKCRARGIPHMIWTHDFDHASAGILWLVGCGLVSPEAAGSLFWSKIQGSSPFRRSFGDAPMLAFGNKKGLGHWVSALMIAASKLKLRHGSAHG